MDVIGDSLGTPPMSLQKVALNISVSALNRYCKGLYASHGVTRRNDVIHLKN